MRTPNKCECLAGMIVMLLVTGIFAGSSLFKPEARREYSLGTNGTLRVTFDSQSRVREFRQFNPDQSLKLRVCMVYGTRDLQKLLVLDPHGREVWKSAFALNSTTDPCRSSDASRGWEIRTEVNSSAMSGDVHDTVSWFCGDDLLYRVHRKWPDDRSHVFCEVTGPAGVLLFTNTYVEK